MRPPATDLQAFDAQLDEYLEIDEDRAEKGETAAKLAREKQQVWKAERMKKVGEAETLSYRVAGFSSTWILHLFFIQEGDTDWTQARTVLHDPRARLRTVRIRIDRLCQVQDLSISLTNGAPSPSASMHHQGPTHHHRLRRQQSETIR